MLKKALALNAVNLAVKLIIRGDLNIIYEKTKYRGNFKKFMDKLCPNSKTFNGIR